MRIASLLVFVFWLFLIGTYIPCKLEEDVFESFVGSEIHYLYNSLNLTEATIFLGLNCEV